MAKKIVLDAGHGLGTFGKQDPDGIKEWTYNQKVLKAVQKHLNDKYEGFEILRTDDPTGKRDVPLEERTNKAGKFKADVLVSMHHNALQGKWGSHGGVETLVQTPLSSNPKSHALAKAIHPKVVKAMGLRDRGIKPMNLHMLREAFYYEGGKYVGIPAVLVEGGFMDSTTDIKALRDDKKLEAQGIAIAEGLAEFLKLPKKQVVEKPEEKKVTYRVVTGSFQDRENAEKRIKELKNKGFDSFIVIEES